MERLQKVLAQAGVCSRRAAEALISEGRVEVDGKIIKELGTKVNLDALIKVDGQIIEYEKKVYYLLNKPERVVCSVKDNFQRTRVVDLVPSDRRVFPVGRLDYFTSGLIIITNDGRLTNLLTHPRFEVEKTYLVTLDKQVSNEDFTTLISGVVIDGIKTSPANGKILECNQVELTIHEGRNRQVRKMFDALGYKVLALDRIKYAFLEKGNLAVGQYRLITEDEVQRLFKIGIN